MVKPAGNGDVAPFLTNVDLGSSVTRSNLLAMVQNTQQRQFLQVELATVVDCEHAIVMVTYRLEGDGPLIFKVMLMLHSLSVSQSCLCSFLCNPHITLQIS